MSRTPALGFIFITLLLDVIGFGLVIPVIPGLLKEMTGGDLSIAARWGGVLMFTYATMQFIFSPIFGGLSDKYGRRPVILASLFAFGIDFIIVGLAPTIWWFFLGRVLAGITGASFSSCSAYIADISPADKKAQNFGLIGAAFGLGFIIGPLIGGVVSAHYGLRAPFFLAAGMALLNWVYGYFILPESLAPENRRPFDWKRANPIGSLLNLRRYPVVLSLAGALMFIYVAAHANQSTWTYITMKKFDWDTEMVGYSLAFVGLMVGIVQGGLTRVVIPRFGAKQSLYFGLAMYTIGFVLFAFANMGWMMFAFMVPFSLGGFAGPALQGIISNQVPANEQGELQGSLTSLLAVTSIIGPLLMTWLFSWFTSEAAPVQFAGAPFLMGAVLCLVSLLLAVRTLKKYGRRGEV
ncbi:MAG: TCR/Tet family MFS transporter [Saprospiraceae bacterium]|nr:TCR/Tet family MFS transporter [Saprospiraceae bacterium]MCF8252670.1 TCR/Tet family MFS transporter [Saprospiraceae bacterium]MCF8282869.1 TCR/Tet family MFS transporter [Bacteroidales bacterium]MCF8314242.1 TCR/Tet family MFS transporter [Saprospiraceae bacterium]MCF8443039.1 TCR/Tet family MFS transporter [Saprospiraceae bacterium]